MEDVVHQHDDDPIAARLRERRAGLPDQRDDHASRRPGRFSAHGQAGGRHGVHAIAAASQGGERQISPRATGRVRGADEDEGTMSWPPSA